LQDCDVILASASPRRRELLRLVFNSFRVVVSSFDESSTPDQLDPGEAVMHSAEGKAGNVAGQFPEALVVAADTIVVVDGEVLGKPKDSADAARMLRKLSGRTHQVYTGVAVARNGSLHSDFERTEVTFRDVDTEMISRYLASGEPMDKAGAYAIQGIGAVLVKAIDGCYFNVVGLPIYRLSLLLERFDIKPFSRA